MNETQRPLRIGRSIGALLAGFLAVVILSLGTDIVLHATGVFPPLGQPATDGLLLLATAYRTVFGVAGSYKPPSVSAGTRNRSNRGQP